MATPMKPTLEEFLALEETKPASEYVDGEVVQKPMPSGWHSVVQGLLSFVFTLYLRSHPIGIAGPEARCIFGPPGRERAYVPDFIFVSATGAPGMLTNGPVRGAPDLAVEVLSPDDRMVRVRQKVRFYLENGVRLVWVIDPEDRTVTVMSSPSASRTLFEDETLDGGGVLPGFSVPVREVLPPRASPAS